MSAQPTLTDGTVTVRPWRDGDGRPTHLGHDEPARGTRFVVEVDGLAVGTVGLRTLDEHTGELTFSLDAEHRGQGWATRAVRVVTDWALSPTVDGGRGLGRVQARIEPGHETSLRVATRSGLRREGLQRVAPGTGDRPETEEYVVLARLATDPPLSDPGAFRSLLNSFLPRKRAIAQMLVRDELGRVLCCQLTYKQDWDLPGGVVEVGESPQVAVGREVLEELSLTIPAGRLLLTDWLPPWGGWDDALCLVFDGGVHPADLVERVVPQAREIRQAAFLDPEQVAERCADFTARRIASALADVRADAAADGAQRGPGYVESGRALRP